MPKTTFFRLSPEKKNRIIDAAISEFSEHSYDNTSIHRIVAGAEISTGSFYQYFENKKDLYFYILSMYLKKLEGYLREHGEKIDLFEQNRGQSALSEFQAQSTDDHFAQIFMDSLNFAPLSIRRDWLYDVIIGEKHFDMYDTKFLDNPEVDDDLRENRYAVLSLLMSLTTVTGLFESRHDKEAYDKLFFMLLDVVIAGIKHYKKPTV